MTIQLVAALMILRARVKLGRVPPERFLGYRNFLAITIPLYLLLPFPAAAAGTHCLRHSVGLNISTWTFMAITISPYPYWYFS